MSAEKTGLIIAGVSGPGVQEFLRTVTQYGFPGEVAAFASANPDSVGKLVGETALRGLSPHDEQRVISIDQAYEVEAPAAVSFLPDAADSIYADSLAAGRLYITGAYANNMRNDVALANPYTNHGQITELFTGGEQSGGRIIAIGGDTSIGAAVAMAPLHRNWGIVSAKVETLQGWRDARSTESDGDEKVTSGRQNGVVAIKKTGRVELEHEPQRLLSRSMSEPASIRIAASLKHGPWRKGYHQVITAELAAPATPKEIEEAWKDWRAPKALKGVHYGATSPVRRPLKTSRLPLIHWKGTDPRLAKRIQPMRVRSHLRAVEDEGRMVTFEIVGDDMSLGYAGSLAMTLAYVRAKGYLGSS